ncbi:hypothetical protein ACFV20_07720 [Streptomyces sp. NPDC059696]|uniref:hypothetical protein n=1 Tax=Streptomyces sp. NPDC059696 TaxID=3346911 RepID=UPI0036AE4749
MTHHLRIRVGAMLATAVLALTGGWAYGAPAVDDMDQDIETAVQGVDAYWDAHWSDFFTGTYVPPTVLGEYDGASADVPLCNGEPLADDNAVYCATTEDYLAWDTDLMRDGYRFGDGFVYLVVAHEWGHAIQNRLDVRLRTIDSELQADCLAGAELEGAARDGTIVFEAGDVDELRTALVLVADETPWTKVGDHGSASERVDAFTRGQQQGVEACLPSAVADDAQS